MFIRSPGCKWTLRSAQSTVPTSQQILSDPFDSIRLNPFNNISGRIISFCSKVDSLLKTRISSFYSYGPVGSIHLCNVRSTTWQTSPKRWWSMIEVPLIHVIRVNWTPQSISIDGFAIVPNEVGNATESGYLCSVCLFVLPVAGCTFHSLPKVQ